MRIRSVLSTAAVLVFLTALTLSACAAESPLTSEDLKYQGASIEVEVDVNGEAAVQLIGGVLDEAARAAQEQAANGKSLPPQVAAAGPMLEPAKQIVKSLSRVTAVVMKTDESAAGLDVIDHYGAKMSPRGWTQLATVRTGKGESVLVMLAPGGKGIFAAIRPNGRELVVALITTREPIGDLLAQVARAGGAQVLPQLLAAKAPQPRPAAGCDEANASEATETAQAPVAE